MSGKGSLLQNIQIVQVQTELWLQKKHIMLQPTSVRIMSRLDHQSSITSASGMSSFPLVDTFLIKPTEVCGLSTLGFNWR